MSDIETVEEVEAVTEEVAPEHDMTMSDDDFENTNFDEAPVEEAEEAPTEEGIETEASVSNEEENSLEELTEAPMATPELDKAVEYDKIMAEFKANGKMMTVDTAEEVRQLMKMGAGFNKKMVGMKKDQRFIKMLQNNDLLDEERLSYLIDLDKKNPQAIAKLLKDSELDPMEIDTENTDYQPNAYTVDDKQVQLDTVLEDLQDSSAYATTIDIVGNKWDETSRNKLASEPELIRTLNAHVESGVYDKVIPVLEKERMLGKLQGVNDFEAYRMVADAMNAQGAFNTTQQATSGTPVAAPARKPDSIVNDKKRAASSTRSKPRSNEQFNIEDMSDEDFEKKFGSGLN